MKQKQKLKERKQITFKQVTHLSRTYVNNEMFQA